MCPNGKIAKIKQVIPCWNNIPNQPSQHMIVFEKDSIAKHIPSERFAIDIGHPMCTIMDYIKHWNSALREAKMYINQNTIYCDTISNIHNGVLDENIRYDLILENSDVYIANNLVIKARKSFTDAGHNNNNYLKNGKFGKK